ncbi:hypothetical protein BKA57DRAFT_540458 [Linnemannia elongata]|nr:hypothetical protein BKA57DRAFT_540458 [Linnemannia elongata]
MKSRPDEDAGVVFWEDFCDLQDCPKAPTTANIHRYIEVFFGKKPDIIPASPSPQLNMSSDGEAHADNTPCVSHSDSSGSDDTTLNTGDLAVEYPFLSIHTPISHSSHQQQHPVNTSLMMRLASFADLPPELQAMIVSLLDGKQDLHSCTLVSRDWHNVFNPILWGAIESYCDTEEISPFVRHRNIAEDVRTPHPETRCTRRCGGVGLRRVVFDFYDYENDEDVFAFRKKSVEALKEHFSTLEVFCAEDPMFTRSLAVPSEEFLAPLSNEDSTTVSRAGWICSGGFGSLQVVALEDMEVGIDDENEQNWVAEHWPRVKVFTKDFGTDRDDDSQLSGFYDEDNGEEFERHPEYLEDLSDEDIFCPWNI